MGWPALIQQRLRLGQDDGTLIRRRASLLAPALDQRRLGLVVPLVAVQLAGLIVACERIARAIGGQLLIVPRFCGHPGLARHARLGLLGGEIAEG